VEKMMMAEVANHNKRNHTNNYFSGKAVTTTSSEEFGTMDSKKSSNNPRPRSTPFILPKVWDPSISQRSCSGENDHLTGFSASYVKPSSSEPSKPSGADDATMQLFKAKVMSIIKKERTGPLQFTDSYYQE
jgi:hypothetical protein